MKHENWDPCHTYMYLTFRCHCFWGSSFSFAVWFM